MKDFFISTFSNADGSAIIGAPGSSETLLYQYRPWWVADVALLPLVARLHVKAIAWAGMVGAVIRSETILRVVVELL